MDGAKKQLRVRGWGMCAVLQTEMQDEKHRATKIFSPCAWRVSRSHPPFNHTHTHKHGEKPSTHTQTHTPTHMKFENLLFLHCFPLVTIATLLHGGNTTQQNTLHNNTIPSPGPSNQPTAPAPAPLPPPCPALPCSHLMRPTEWTSFAAFSSAVSVYVCVERRVWAYIIV